MKKFNTFDEVVIERKRLESDLIRQQAFVRTEFAEFRQKLNPLGRMLSFIGRFGSSNSNNSPTGNLLKLGSNIGIDFLIGRKLKSAGWMARVALPFLMKFTANRSIDALKKR